MPQLELSAVYPQRKGSFKHALSGYVCISLFISSSSKEGHVVMSNFSSK